MYWVGVGCLANLVFHHAVPHVGSKWVTYLVHITIVYFGLQVSEGHTVYLFSLQDNKDNRRKRVDIFQSTKKTSLFDSPEISDYSKNIYTPLVIL